MQLRIKEKILFECSWKRILYALSFFLVCVIDQQVKVTSTEGLATRFPDLTGIAMAMLILSHYKWKDFTSYKLPFLVWTGISVVAGTLAIIWGVENVVAIRTWIGLVVQAMVYGYIIIRTVINVVIEKRYPRINKISGVLWLVMMMLMMASRSTQIWPFYFFVIFGCLCLTDFTEEEQKDMFQGMLDGIILAFFVFQIFCYMFRPYDIVRYSGAYFNPNLNAFFYLQVLAAVLGKLLYVTKNNASKWIRVYYWLGAGTVLSHIFLTIGRTAWLVAFMMGLIFLWAVKRMQQKKNFIKNGIVLVLCTCLTFPICFGLVRYLPPAFHHPIWFEGEWAEERVHSWDPWNSDKYIDIDEFMEVALGRIWDTLADALEESPLLLKTQAAEAVEDMGGFTEEEVSYFMKNSIAFRKYIYSDYAKNLNLWGHTTEEMLEYESYYFVSHAHNIFLQYGTEFGSLMLVIFVVLICVSFVILARRFWRHGNVQEIAYMLFLLATVGFGLFEYSYGVGSIGPTMMFFVFTKVICDEERE